MVLGPLISGAVGLFGASSQRRHEQRMAEQAWNRNTIKRTVKHAKAAGIHPLEALRAGHASTNVGSLGPRLASGAALANSVQEALNVHRSDIADERDAARHEAEMARIEADIARMGSTQSSGFDVAAVTTRSPRISGPTATQVAARSTGVWPGDAIPARDYGLNDTFAERPEAPAPEPMEVQMGGTFSGMDKKEFEPQKVKATPGDPVLVPEGPDVGEFVMGLGVNSVGRAKVWLRENAAAHAAEAERTTRTMRFGDTYFDREIEGQRSRGTRRDTKGNQKPFVRVPLTMGQYGPVQRY